MNGCRLFFAALILLCLSAATGRSEEIVEVWRRPFASGVVAMAVDPADGSIWVGYDHPAPLGRDPKDGELLHFTPDGGLLGRAGDVWPSAVSVNAADGSVWAVHWYSTILHLAEDGTELWRSLPTEAFPYTESLSANSADGSCWVAAQGLLEPFDESRPYQFWNDSSVTHLSAAGGVLWRGENFKGPYSVAVSPIDGSCFVVQQGDYSNFSSGPDWPYAPGDWVDYGIVRLAADGRQLWRTSGVGVPPGPISLDPSDGSAWFGDFNSAEVVHLSPGGDELWRGGAFDSPGAVAASSPHGGCWVADLLWDSLSDYPSGDLVFLGADGTELWRSEPEMWAQHVTYAEDISLCADPADGTCWVYWKGRPDTIVHIAQDGTELLRTVGGFEDLFDLAVNPANGSCRVLGQWTVIGGSVGCRFGEDGAELGRTELDLQYHPCLALNPSDGSWWVAASGLSSTDIVHLAEDGTELWRGSVAEQTRALAVDPTDGSCWAAGGFDAYYSWVAHLRADGTELWRGQGTGFNGPASLAVNPADGSCWVADTENHQVVHLGADGTELWRGGDFDPLGRISVDAADGSCWVVAGDVVHLAADGTELWRGEGLGAEAIAVNPADRSRWAIVDGDWSEEWEQTLDDVVHLAQDGAELSRRSGFADLVALSVNSTDGSCWVADAGRGQVVRLKPIPFPDIPFDHWAYDHIKACVGSGIVGGYDDGFYHPERSVTRGQMSVFVARGLAGGDEGVPDFAGTPTFPDVDAGHWALDYVEYVVSQNVVGGYEDGTYHPEREVTRGQMAIYVARAMVAPTTSVLSDYVPAEPRNFPDVDSGHWAYTYVEYCVEQGIVGGFLDGTYRPDVVVTRDQMAIYVARAFELLE
jgi:DNA-binding beta-propeller fold protein YncE